MILRKVRIKKSSENSIILNMINFIKQTSDRITLEKIKFILPS